uniref:Serine palmitoyltransferase small subunit B n=6 Tax=Neoaves TaxID=3078114 RepID=A0A8C3J7W8_9CHAR
QPAKSHRSPPTWPRSPLSSPPPRSNPAAARRGTAPPTPAEQTGGAQRLRQRGGAEGRGEARTGPPPARRRPAGARSRAGSSSQNHCKLKMDIKRVKDYIYWLYYQYLLITCSYVLEPWEQSMFHTIIVTVFAMVVYTAYVFVPIHVRLAFEFFSQIFGGQPESTVSIVN